MSAISYRTAVSYRSDVGYRTGGNVRSARHGNAVPRDLAAPLAPAPRLHLTTRGRAVVAFLIAVPLAIAAVAFGVGVFGVGATEAVAGSTTGSAASFNYVTVDPGESLWQLAETVAPTADPRDVIADIVTLNNLSSSDVQPGQRLAIPAKYGR